MQKESVSITEGSLWKGIFVFSIPLAASNILQVLFNMSDVAVVGRFAGDAALGSVGSTTILVALFTGLILGAGSGTNVLVARYLGAKDDRTVRQTVNAALVVCLAFGLAVLLIGGFFAEGILILLDTKADLIDGAALYLKIYVLGMPALGLYNFGSGVLSAAGDTKHPLIYLFSAGIVNVLLNLFFVIVFRMGGAGVAIASVISQYLSAFLVLFHLARVDAVYAFRLRGFSLSAAHLWQVLAIGIPSGLQNAIFQIANLFIQRSVNSFDTLTVEGNSAAANADALVYDVMAAFYTGCSTYIGQNYGAGNLKRVKKSYLVSLTYSFGIALLLGLSLVLFGPYFLALFTKNPAVVEKGMMRLMVMGFSYPFSAFMDCAIAASRGLGKSGVPTAIVILGSCVFRLVWVYTIFAFFHTILSLYLLYIVSWTITAIAENIYFIHCYRRLAAQDGKKENIV